MFMLLIIFSNISQTTFTEASGLQGNFRPNAEYQELFIKLYTDVTQ